MLKTSMTRGLVVGLALALLCVGGGSCGSSEEGTSRSAQMNSFVSPEENTCGWPDFGQPETARAMLDHIAGLVLADASAIDAQLKVRLDRAIQECLSPDLRNDQGRHVCLLQHPLPNAELSGIKLHAEDPAYQTVNPKPLKPTTPSEHWETIAQELESFPTGR